MPALSSGAPPRPQVLLIGGMPRSGTTLLANLVQREFGIPVAPETHFFDMAGRVGLEGLPEELRRDPRVIAAYAGLDPRGPDRIGTFRTLLARLLPEGAPVLAEKTPDHLIHFGWLLRADSEFRAIVIVRACEEVCNSLARMPWNDHSPIRNLRLWVWFYRLAAQLKREFPNRLAVVSYERLCTDPDATLARVAGELSLPQVVPPTALGASYDAALEPWKAGADGPVRAAARSGTPALRWRERQLARLADRLLRLFLRIPGLG